MLCNPPAPAPATVPAITNVVLSAEERAAERPPAGLVHE
jgi:hypothetical protein